MAYNKDLRELLAELERRGKLITITREINKDTQLHPLMRIQYRGLPEGERKAWRFTNVVDSRGRKYSVPVVSGVFAASRDIYAIAMMCKREEVRDRWVQALLHPIEPVMVKSGPVQEEVHVGDTLLKHGGLDEFPIPISTPGYDIAPFFTCPNWITKDPETGVRNVGTYRAHVKSPTRTGIFTASAGKGAREHWAKWRAMGKPMPAALVNGVMPVVGFVATTGLPTGVDELTIAGGLAGEPLPLVKCKTVDLEVPAYAELVIEGEISTDEVEPESPFGEATGYMGQREMMPYFNIKCITHRQKPIWQSYLSQFVPSESLIIKSVGGENTQYKHLKYDLGLKSVQQVSHLTEAGDSYLTVVQIKKENPDDARKVMDALGGGKMVVLVDDDINPRDPIAVNWAIQQRVQPHRDVRILKGRPFLALDPSLEPPGGGARRDVRYSDSYDMPESSSLIIDATRKWPYSPISLPKKEFMEEALRIWKQEKLPEVNLKEPWYGYNLGYWSEEFDHDATLATQGKYYETGEKLARGRKKI